MKRLGAMWRVEARALSQNAQPVALKAIAKVTRRGRRGRRTMGGNRREKKRGERVAIKRRTRDTTQQPGGRIDTHGRRLRRMLQDMNPASPLGLHRWCSGLPLLTHVLPFGERFIPARAHWPGIRKRFPKGIRRSLGVSSQAPPPGARSGRFGRGGVRPDLPDPLVRPGGVIRSRNSARGAQNGRRGPQEAP